MSRMEDGVLAQVKALSMSHEVDMQACAGFDLEGQLKPLAEQLDVIQKALSGSEEGYSVASQLQLVRQENGAVALSFKDGGPVKTQPLLKELYCNSSGTGHVAGIYNPPESASNQTGILFVDGMKGLQQAVDKTLARHSEQATGLGR